MAKVDAGSELIASATALEEGLRSLELLTAALGSSRLGTEKGIQRASRELQDAMRVQEQLGLSLQSFGQVILRLQERQRTATERLGEHARTLRERAEALSELMQRYAGVGERAGAIAQLLGRADQHPGGPAGALADVADDLNRVFEEARGLADEAETREFSDVAREAKALQQRLHSIRIRAAAGRPS